MKFVTLLIFLFSIESYAHQSKLFHTHSDEEKKLELASNLHTTKLIAKSINLKVKKFVTSDTMKKSIPQSNPHFSGFLSASMKLVDEHFSESIVANIYAQALNDSSVTIEHLRLMDEFYNTTFGEKIGNNLVLKKPLKTGLTSSEWNKYLSYLENNNELLIEYLKHVPEIQKSFESKISFQLIRLQSDHKFVYKEHLDKIVSSR